MCLPIQIKKIVLFLSVFVSTGLSGQAVAWKAERLLGSARLALAELNQIQLPSEPSIGLLAAVDDLIAYWPVPMEQQKVGSSWSKNSIILIREPVPDLWGSNRRGANTEEFSIRRVRTKVYLRASSDQGLVNGIYSICRELLGTRWYWPGELGFERVGEIKKKFPEHVWRERPAFEQRAMRPFDADYVRRNGLERRYHFNHNLANIFSKEIFEEFPELFAEIGGERTRPKGSAATDPQPDFTEPESVELAATAARTHFSENPDANSYSLSINDNSLFDEGAATEAVVSPVEYFRGRPNYTDLVFGFMNEVATRVFDSRDSGFRIPDGGGSNWVSNLTSGLCPQSSEKKPYLTALAYYWTEQSPSFKLHPQVMPVLTSDRAQWHDPYYRAEDKALIQRWADSGAKRIATWDYYFGAPYPYPRQFTQWMKESLRFLHKSGVDVFYSQLPSVWGLDGPKAWLAAELLRDPKQDADLLLEEYYTNFFGPAAGPIREFYEIAEKTRNEREGTANWIKFYKDEAGIELFSEATLKKMRACIEFAKVRVGVITSSSSMVSDGHGSDRILRKAMQEPNPAHLDERFAKRVQLVSDAFSYTESYAAYHRSRLRLVGLSFKALQADSDQVSATGLLLALEDYEAAKSTFRALSTRLAKEPMHGGFSAFNRLKQSEPLPLALAAFARLEISPEVLNLPDRATLLSEMRGLKSGAARLVSVGKNAGLVHSEMQLRNFLGPELPVIDAWRIQYRASEGLRMERASGLKASGLRVENADIVAISRTFPVLAEQTYLLKIDAGWRVSPDNRTRIQLNWKSISGERIRTDIALRLPSGISDGCQQLEFGLIAPINAYDLKVAVVTNRQYSGDFIELNKIELGRLISER